MRAYIWLASYPKSGNTWFRVFLTNLLRNDDRPADINRLESTVIASARPWLDDELGYDSSNLTADEADCLRAELYAHRAKGADAPLFCKIHDAYVNLPDGSPLIPLEATDRALYLIRNPLDVCVSLAHHGGHDRYADIAAVMADSGHVLAAAQESYQRQLRQRLLSWSEHVRSWTQSAPFPVHVMRYEDMCACPEMAFSAAASFIGLPHDLRCVEKALRFSRFEELKRQEEANGFRERLPKSACFFRAGRVGSWIDALSPAVVRRLIGDHMDVMREFGYVDGRGNVVIEPCAPHGAARRKKGSLHAA